MDAKLAIVITTTKTKAQASRLAERAVQERYAACAQISGPIESYYQWKGKAEREAEWRLLFKTLTQAVPRLNTFLLQNHPYDEPQIVAVEAESGSEGYWEWVNDNVEG